MLVRCTKCRQVLDLPARYCSHCANPIFGVRRKSKALGIAAVVLLPLVAFALTVFLFWLTRPSAKNTPTITKRKAIIDTIKLAGKPVSTVEQMLGKPSAVAVINDYPKDMPGQYRDYRINGLKGIGETEAGLSIQYYKGKVDGMLIEFETPVETAEEALMLVGIDVGDKKPSRITAFATVWDGLTVSGVQFRDFGAQPGMDQKDRRFIRVIVNLKRP